MTQQLACLRRGSLEDNQPMFVVLSDKLFRPRGSQDIFARDIEGRYSRAVYE